MGLSFMEQHNLLCELLSQFILCNANANANAYANAEIMRVVVSAVYLYVLAT